MSRSKTLYYNDAKHWVKRPSGIVTPDGRCKDFLEYSQNSFVEIKQMAIEVDGMFHEAGIVLNPTCSLRQLIEDAKLLADTSVDGSVDSSERSVHMRGCLALRITQAILSLKDEPNITSHLSRLGSGSLNLFKKGESTVKNFFWEIETFASLKRHGLNPLFEEPDLSVSIDGVQIGVACKKIYSEKNVGKVLSNAAAQIATRKRPGIVAINLDDLHQLDEPITGSTYGSINQALSDFNVRFIGKHERHLRKYLGSSRITACMISSHHYGDATAEQARLNNYSETTCWAIPNLGGERQRLSDAFYGVFRPIKD